jgi:hypothetical protein
VDTGLTPTAIYPSGVANPATYKIYLGGSREDIDHFEVYDVLDDSLTTLASPPLDYSGNNEYSSVTLTFAAE